MGAVNFFSEEIDFKLPHPRRTIKWIRETLKLEDKTLDYLNFIFCSDNYLYQINFQYLNHNTYTDIVTFNQSDLAKVISGDIYISIDRINENAFKFGVSFIEELYRVIIHGVLHLMGYDDKGQHEILTMRNKEAMYLSLLASMFHVKH